ncbi:hypothetical protein J3F83DRAFT_768579 [Trichoderma novae-zelandiae]
MVHYYKALPDNLREWALQQKVFFAASAPLSGRHINVSPKDLLDVTFHIFDPNHAAYMDTAGTGIETISHVYENKRITHFFCSLDEKPRIMRLFCTGNVVERTDLKFPGLNHHAPLGRNNHSKHSGEKMENCRCFKERPTLEKLLHTIVKRGKLEPFIQDANARSIDGLLGLREARRMKGEWLFAHEAGAWLRLQLHQCPAITFGILIGLFLFAYSTAILTYFIHFSFKLYRVVAWI